MQGITNLKDVQNEPDDRNIDLTRVGIKGIKYPINVLDRTNKTQATVATVNMYVHLPHRFKGTHMSRFVEVLNDYCADLNLKTFFEMLDRIKNSLDAPAANLEIRFPYFIKKNAPVSGVPSMMQYTCKYIGEINGTERKLLIGVKVPVCTLCPCSKEISSQGAHNQRGVVSVTLLFKEFFWIEEIIEIVEGSASSEVFALLKREDEKFITEQAYSRPMFVEDVVREVTDKLKKDPRFISFSVEAENFESIHNHSAYAYTEAGPQPL
ncbi:MAG: GTP cyclohydrolase I FolE2 [Desulfobacterales bacterium]|nr:GTP cyclohydrolase I FolE2 [Desulfobacterales bacterium]